MKIYFAGISGNVKRLNYLKEFGATKLMLTFADAKFYGRQMERFKNMNFEILLDSGAFSTWKRGTEIKIDDYCSFIRKHSINNYITLDAVGDARRTEENTKAMESNGFSPIPVFHMGASLTVLERLLDEYPYICLGGSVGATYAKRVNFFRSVFNFAPKHQFHGLGLTDSRIMKMFPFFSVDSTTWLTAEKNGKILTIDGVQIKAPLEMDAKTRFENTIKYFVNIELLDI